MVVENKGYAKSFSPSNRIRLQQFKVGAGGREKVTLVQGGESLIA
jgi:hypothetical protein